VVPTGSPGTGQGIRIFTFGESAVAGLGTSENGSFPRALERRLNAPSRGSRTKPSVVNLGIVALSSRQILAVERDILHTLRSRRDVSSRDFFLFNVGNNEFLELHAKRYMGASGRAFVMEHLGIARAIERLKLKRESARMTTRTFSTADLRVTESRLIGNLSLSNDEIDHVVAEYAANIRAMVELARSSGVTPVLTTVPTNLEWAGREELTHPLDDAIRWKATFEQAKIFRALGNADAARKSFVLAKDQDPHLRRCLSRMNQRVREIAASTGTLLIDLEDALSHLAPDGIVGFQFLYDYVHYTPLGAELVAQEIDRALTQSGLIELGPFDENWVSARTKALASARRDSLELADWIGWNTDKAMLKDRDLWKYEKMRKRLSEATAKEGASMEDLVWAGNGYALEYGGEATAIGLYQRAHAIAPKNGAIVRNLQAVARLMGTK
jgi:hypothetical protein